MLKPKLYNLETTDKNELCNELSEYCNLKSLDKGIKLYGLKEVGIITEARKYELSGFANKIILVYETIDENGQAFKLNEETWKDLIECNGRIRRFKYLNEGKIEDFNRTLTGDILRGEVL